MVKRSLLPEAVEHYVTTVTRETPLQKRLRDETASMPLAIMQIGADLGALLALLVRLTSARRALEVGTYTGYSALAIAQALPDDGRLLTCDLSGDWIEVARRYWSEAGVAGRIDFHQGAAIELLLGLSLGGAAGSFDLAFIDADKHGYEAYYEACLSLLRPGGVMVIDNMLWFGEVADEAKTDAVTESLRRLSRAIRDDPRVDPVLLTVGDGALVLWKRAAA